jgi:arsenate reductase
MFSATFAGIAPASVSAFIAAQILGGALAVAVVLVLYPGVTAADAARIVVPHPQAGAADLPGTAAGSAGAPADRRQYR